jgi:hypothetical protein
MPLLYILQQVCARCNRTRTLRCSAVHNVRLLSAGPLWLALPHRSRVRSRAGNGPFDAFVEQDIAGASRDRGNERDRDRIASVDMPARRQAHVAVSPGTGASPQPGRGPVLIRKRDRGGSRPNSSTNGSHMAGVPARRSKVWPVSETRWHDSRNAWGHGPGDARPVPECEDARQRLHFKRHRKLRAHDDRPTPRSRQHDSAQG